LLLALAILVLSSFYQIESISIMSSDSGSESNSLKTLPEKKTEYLCSLLEKMGRTVFMVKVLARQRFQSLL
jgi:hypothetical protein